jgi:hypothetical protein
MIILEEQFKVKLKEVIKIAKDASKCPFLDEDLQDEAKYVHEILLDIEDYIRQREIDHLLSNHQNQER